MTRHPARTYALLAGICITLNASIDTAHSQEIEDYQNEFNEIVNQLNDNQSWIRDADRSIKALSDNLELADRRINELGRQRYSIEEEINQLNDQIVGLQADQAVLDNAKQEQLQHLSWHLVAANELQSKGVLRILLKTDDPAKLKRLMHYYQVIANKRIAGLQEFQKLLNELTVNGKQLEQRRLVLQENQLALTKQADVISVEQESRLFSITQLGDELLEKRNYTSKLVADRDRLTTLMESLTLKQYLGNSTSRISQGSLVWPVAGEVKRRYGQPRADGRLKWEGIYFGAPENSRVTAIAGGEVLFAGWLQGFGMAIIIQHTPEQMSLYGYCDSIFKQSGDLVEAGEPIATVGRSGGQTEFGMYFEIREHGKPTDPLVWLGDRGQ